MVIYLRSILLCLGSLMLYGIVDLWWPSIQKTGISRCFELCEKVLKPTLNKFL